MSGNRKLRYASLTPEQQAEFDSWNTKQQSYCLYRVQGVDKANAFRMAGYTPKNAGQGGYILENRTKPRMPEIIRALTVTKGKFDALKADSETTKELEEKAKGLNAEQKVFLTKIPEDSAYLDNKPFDLNEVTVEQAKDIQFYRKIADGTLKSVTITKKYDKEGNIVSKTIVEESSLEMRMKAQKEVMRKVGIADVLEIGKIEANNINVMIVDASKKAETEDSRNTITGTLQEVDGEMALVTEKEENV